MEGTRETRSENATVVLSTADERNDVGRRKGKKKKRKVEGVRSRPQKHF